MCAPLPLECNKGIVYKIFLGSYWFEKKNNSTDRENKFYKAWKSQATPPLFGNKMVAV